MIHNQNPFSLEFKWNENEKEEWQLFWQTYPFPKPFPKPPRVLYQLQRLIEAPYRNLPWPQDIRHIAVHTMLAHGRGDTATAAKVIKLMQRMCPSLTFDWIIDAKDYDAATFLKDLDDPSKVKIYNHFPTERKADFCMEGPACRGGSDAKNSPLFVFFEIDYPTNYFNGFVFDVMKELRERGDKGTVQERYQQLHKTLFAATGRHVELVMGIQEGTGVFLDVARLNAPLSRGDCCPRYLGLLEDPLLRKDILESLGVQATDSLPDYDKYSLNFGYAHLTNSWKKFIDFVAVHERQKMVTIVLNQNGCNNPHSIESFGEQVFTAERLSFLKKWGYGKIAIKGQEQEPLLVQTGSEPTDRSLTIILRRSFSPSDVRNLQLASERLLATGDNTPAESWAARCKLFVYEIWNGKAAFFYEQASLAEKVSPQLGKLMTIFSRAVGELSAKEMSEAIDILLQPSLSQATLDFCNLVTKSHSFADALEGALKRTAWHHRIPRLIDLEAEVIDEQLQSQVINYLSSEEAVPNTATIKNLPLLSQRIEQLVKQ